MERIIYFPGEEPDPTLKLFYYNIEDFFNLSRDETFYRTVTADADKLIADIHAMTEDRRAIFDTLLRRGASKAFEIIQPYSRDIINAFRYNTLPSMTVSEINALDPNDLEIDLLIEMEDGGVLEPGTLTVEAGDFVKYDGAEWVDDSDSTIKYILYYMYLPYGFDLNNIEVLDQKIFEFIVMYVVKEWFKRQKYDLQLVLMEFDELSKNLKTILNYRAKPVHRDSGPF